MTIKELTPAMREELKADLVCELSAKPQVLDHIPNDTPKATVTEIKSYGVDHYREIPDELLDELYKDWCFDADEFYCHTVASFPELDYKKPFNGLHPEVFDVYDPAECYPGEMKFDVGFREPADLYFDEDYVDCGYASYRDFYHSVNQWLQVVVDTDTGKITEIWHIWDTDSMIDGFSWSVDDKEMAILQRLIDYELE